MTLASMPLSELATVHAGGGAPQDSAAFSRAGSPFIRAGSLSKLLDGAGEDSLERIEPAVAKQYGLRLYPAGTVLFAKSGMSATKGLVYRLRKPAYVVNHLAALVPHETSDSAFLAQALRRFSPTVLIKDAAYPSIRLGDIESMRIRAPRSPADRERIAAVLEKADTLRAKRRSSLMQLDALNLAIFLDMFGDPATNPKGWPDSTQLCDVAEIVSGVTIGRNLAGKATRTVPYLAVVNVQDRRLDLTLTKTTEATEQEIQRYRLEQNDLLLTEGGDPDKLGRGTLWSKELPECIHQNHVFRVRLRSEEVTPLFLNWLVGSQRGKRYFLRSAKQTTGIASINMTQLRAFPLLSPPLALQLEFARRLSVSDAIRNQQLAGLAELESLFASLQQHAFSAGL